MDPSPQLIAIALFFSCILLYNALIKKKSIKGNQIKKAPEPDGAWPIIGHLHLLSGGDQLLYRTLGAMADKYGSAFTIRLGSRRAFVVSSWKVVKECFTINDKALASRPTTVAAKHMGYNYAVFGFAPYSSFWREMRKIATLELLSNRRLEMLKHVQDTKTKLLLKDLHDISKKNEGYVMVETTHFFLLNMYFFIFFKKVIQTILGLTKWVDPVMVAHFGPTYLSVWVG